MARDEDWDELGGRPRKGRKPKKGASGEPKPSGSTTSTTVRSRTNFFAVSTTDKVATSG
ncbi:MAG: hypothetical protein CM15mP78_16460 [Candidatus Poseidoniales archaeon]|nr:MAG: hypothetical protein CM15mP78_16460 [Candidatus Poseidoniales archaeon]